MAVRDAENKRRCGLSPEVIYTALAEAWRALWKGYMCAGRWRSLKTGSRLEKSHPPATANAIMNSQQLRLLALDLDVTGSLDSQSQVGDGVMGPYFFLLN